MVCEQKDPQAVLHLQHISQASTRTCCKAVLLRTTKNLSLPSNLPQLGQLKTMPFPTQLWQSCDRVRRFEQPVLLFIHHSRCFLFAGGRGWRRALCRGHLREMPSHDIGFVQCGFSRFLFFFFSKFPYSKPIPEASEGEKTNKTNKKKSRSGKNFVEKHDHQTHEQVKCHKWNHEG